VARPEKHQGKLRDLVDSATRYTRRTEGKRVHGRSARVLESVLEAAAEELGRVGFSGLRVEDVAMRSGVNKTTIYRRWPTKSDLIAAVIGREDLPVEEVDTGALESDIRETLLQIRTRLYTLRHRGVMRVLMGERAVPEVAQLVRDVRERHMSVRRRIFERAMQRGEIAVADAETLVEFLTAPLVSRIMHLGQEVDDAYIELLTRVSVSGAKGLR
jgi:AcrR family transcriptional regulator